MFKLTTNFCLTDENQYALVKACGDTPGIYLRMDITYQLDTTLTVVAATAELIMQFLYNAKYLHTYDHPTGSYLYNEVVADQIRTYIKEF